MCRDSLNFLKICSHRLMQSIAWIIRLSFAPSKKSGHSMFVDPIIKGSWDRRSLIAGLGILPVACKAKTARSQIVGADHRLGHRLRGGTFPPPEPGAKVDTLILGAGVSGLSAAYTLSQAGHDDFHILDLADEAGGNARAGSVGEFRFPWGAHYLPQPDPENKDLLGFLEDAGVITSYAANGEAVYNEEYLCHDIEERLFYQGAWHEGLIPWKSLSPEAVKDMNSFLAFTEVMRRTKGRDTRLAFKIPLDLSSHDTKLLELDRMSLA
ncbi:MAG: NAD(P)/FAD-dependent oxidoreductase, partial [Proteobacteria bacterium]